MSEVKRYRCDWDGKQLFQEVHNTGEYVLYSDYEKLKAQLEKAETSLDKAITSAEFFARHADCRKDSWACRCEFCKNTDASKNIREAREYFKEKEQV